VFEQRQPEALAIVHTLQGQVAHAVVILAGKHCRFTGFDAKVQGGGAV
jgi:hypothetical protein